MLTTEVFLSLPRITAMEYGDLDLSLIPTVRLGYITKSSKIYGVAIILIFYYTVDRYYVDLFDNTVPVPVVRGIASTARTTAAL